MLIVSPCTSASVQRLSSPCPLPSLIQGFSNPHLRSGRITLHCTVIGSTRSLWESALPQYQSHLDSLVEEMSLMISTKTADATVGGGFLSVLRFYHEPPSTLQVNNFGRICPGQMALTPLSSGQYVLQTDRESGLYDNDRYCGNCLVFYPESHDHWRLVDGIMECYMMTFMPGPRNTRWGTAEMVCRRPTCRKVGQFRVTRLEQNHRLVCAVCGQVERILYQGARGERHVDEKLFRYGRTGQGQSKRLWTARGVRKNSSADIPD